MHIIFKIQFADLRQYLVFNIKLTVIAIFSLFAFSAQQSSAQTVQPMVFDLEPLGTESSDYLRIDNPTSGPITLELVPLKIILDEYGKESHESAEDDFLIYPPQTIIQADSTQVVKVKYIGDPLIEKSQAYRISVNQLPVNLNTESSGISILTNFLTLVNVVPDKAKPQLQVTEIKPHQNDRWVVTVRNSGNRYGILSNSSWEVESTNDSSQKEKIDSAEVERFIHQTMILPKSVLHFSVPAVDGFDPASTKITMVKES